MAINFTTNIMTLYGTNVSNDASYQSPGTYGIPALRSGSGGIGAITVGGTNNAYTSAPTFSVTDTGATGTGAAFVVRMKLATAAVNAAGTGYVPGELITMTYGTPVSSATRSIITVATTKLVSATIAAGGTGYGNAQTFTATVVGGTSTTAAQVSVTSNAGGQVVTLNSVSTAGSYTVNPTLSGAATTGGTGSGLTLNLVFGVNTITISTAGQYTVVATTATQASTSGSGTGFTTNTMTFSVDSVAVTPGSGYTGNLSGTFSAGNATATVAYATGDQNETRLLTLIEVIRAYFASVGSAEEAAFARDILMRMMSKVRTGGTAFSAATVATSIQKAGIQRYIFRPRTF